MINLKLNKIHFTRWTLTLLIYTVIVILWGAWVRISHSGDGCGDTWPLCHGELIPEIKRGKTWVEFGHRLMSGIYGLLIVFIWFQARKFFEKPSFGRSAAKATLIFMVIEALLGAKLVLFKLVTTNATPYRAFVMALHQVNSFMLTGAIAFTYFASQSTSTKSKNLKPESLNSHSGYNKYRFFPLVILILAITGAWAALSNSLFPENNLAAGLIADFSESSHFLIRLRIFHPVFAILGAGSLALFFWVKAQTTEESTSGKSALVLSLILACQILFGLATLFFHAPSWMKIVHLGFAHLIWIFLLKWLYFLKIAHTVDR